MPSFEEIVKDAENFPDNLQWQLADGLVVSLGDIRNKIRAYDQGFTQKTQEVAKQRQELQRQQQELANAYALFQQQAQEFQQAQQAAAANQRPAQQYTGDIFSEPGEYFKPLVDRYQTIEKQIKDYENRLQSIFDLARDSISWVADREVEKDYEAAKQAFKDYWDDNELSRDTLTKYAHENKIVDKRGFPLVKSAAERYLSPKMRERELAEAEKKGYEKATKERPNAPIIPRPGMVGQQPATNGKNYNGDLSSLFTDLRQDPDVNNNLAQLFGYSG